MEKVTELMGGDGGGGGGGGESDAVNAVAESSNTRLREVKRKVKRKKNKLIYIWDKMNGSRNDTIGNKIYKITLEDGKHCYSYLSPAEFYACREAGENFFPVPYCKPRPGYVKWQSDLLCHQYYTSIQKSRVEMADYVLVEPMAVKTILILGVWAHMNFKAKHKDAEDSSAAVYFAELNVVEEKVTCLTKLDIDFSADTSAYKCCYLCHREPGDMTRRSVGGGGCVYHPIDAKLFFSKSK